MPLRTNVFRRKAVFYFRIRVPADLCPSLISRKELKRSLGTGEPRLARRRAAIALAAAHAVFETLRRRGGTMTRIEIEELVRRFYEARLDAERLEEGRGVDIDATPLTAEERARAREAQDPFLREEKIRAELANGSYARVRELAHELVLRASGEGVYHEFTSEGPAFRHLCQCLMRAQIELARAQKARQRGDFFHASADPLLLPSEEAAAIARAYETPPDPEFGPKPIAFFDEGPAGSPPTDAATPNDQDRGTSPPPASAPAVIAEIASAVAAAIRPMFAGPTSTPGPAWAPAGPSPALAPGARLPPSAHADACIGEKKRAGGLRSLKTIRDYKRSIRAMESVVGAKPIGELTELDLLAFKEAMLAAPAHYQTKFGTASVPDAIERNRKLKTPWPPFARGTLEDKYFSNLRQFFAWAAHQRLIAADPSSVLKVDPGKGRRSRHSSADRDPFTLKELQTIFGAHEFKSGGPRNHKFWAPLFMLFGGLRPGELGQLELSDIVDRWGWPHLSVTTQRDIELGADGKPIARISPQSDGQRERSDPDDEDENDIKTPAGKRLVPVHPELIRIGFLEYVEAIRAVQNENAPKRLFPEWKKDRYGYYSTQLGKWFNRTFLQGLKIKKKKNCLYSLRHCAEDAFDDSQVSEKTRDRIMGHARNDMPSRYGSGRLRQKQSEEFRAKFRIEGLQLTHISYGSERAATKSGSAERLPNCPLPSS